MGHDDFVDITTLRRHEGREETLLIFLRALGDFHRVGIRAEDDLHRALGAHDRDLRGGPGIVEIAAQMLGRHHVIGAAEGLARDDRNLRHRGLRIGEQQLRAMLDEPAIFLRRARQEPRHIDEGDDGNVEGVAEAHEARGLA